MISPRLLSHLHDVRVTALRPDCLGSIYIDDELMDRASLVAYQQVLVASLEGARRWWTYAVPASARLRGGNGPAGPARKIVPAGPSAAQTHEGERLVVLAFGELQRPTPQIVVCDPRTNEVDAARTAAAMEEARGACGLEIAPDPAYAGDGADGMAGSGERP